MRTLFNGGFRDGVVQLTQYRSVLAITLVLLVVGAHFVLSAVVRGEENSQIIKNSQEEIAQNEVKKSPPRKVKMMTVGADMSVGVRAEVVKKNIVTIVAQTAGVVRSVDVSSGARVWAGSRLMRLGDTYVGASVANINAGLAMQIAQTQSEITHKTERNIDILRKNLNKTNSDGVSMSRRDLSMSKRNAQIAQFNVDANRARGAVSANMMRPASPIGGTVERVLVRVGQVVSPGTPLAVVRGAKSNTELVINLTKSIAGKVDIAQPVAIEIGEQKHFAQITHISTDGVGGVFVATVKLNNVGLIAQIADGDFLDTQITLIGGGDGHIIPLDAVRMSDGGAIVFVNDNGIAKAQTVNIGGVIGSLVTVTGLSQFAQIILDRNVIAGQAVEVK